MKKPLIKYGVFATITFFVIVLIGPEIYSLWGSPQIIFANQSRDGLNNVTLSGTGFEKVIDWIPPKTTRIIKVKPKSESSLKLSFIVNDEFYLYDDLSYMESYGGYRIEITVTPELEIKIISKF